MKGVLHRILTLHPGEGKKAFLFSLLGYLWSVAAFAGLKYSDALFITHVGAKFLPNIYTIVSCGMILLSVFSIYAYHHLSGRRIFIILNIIGIIFYTPVLLLFLLGFTPQSHFLWYALRVFSSLFFYSMFTSYWAVIDQYMKDSLAKRLFGLITSALFLGAMTSGSIMRFGLINLSGLLLMIILLLLATIFWAARVIKSEPVADHSPEESDALDLIEQGCLKSLLKSVASSSYIRLIFFGTFVAFILWPVMEYTYVNAFVKHLNLEALSETEAFHILSRFLGKCLSVVSVATLIFGLLIYPRLVGRYGTGGIILLTPILFFLAFSGWLFYDCLLFPLLGFYVVEGSIEITEDSNLNLLLLNAPLKVKSIVRVIVNSFFEPLGMLVASSLLCIPNIESKWLGLCLASCSIGTAFTIRYLYFIPAGSKAEPIAAKSA